MTKLGTYLVLKKIWNPIDFQGQRWRDTPRFALPLFNKKYSPIYGTAGSMLSCIHVLFQWIFADMFLFQLPRFHRTPPYKSIFFFKYLWWKKMSLFHDSLHINSHFLKQHIAKINLFYSDFNFIDHFTHVTFNSLNNFATWPFLSLDGFLRVMSLDDVKNLEKKKLLWSPVYVILNIMCFITPNFIYTSQGPSWSWSYGSWIYNYLCNQCL